MALTLTGRSITFSPPKLKEWAYTVTSDDFGTITSFIVITLRCSGRTWIPWYLLIAEHQGRIPAERFCEIFGFCWSTVSVRVTKTLGLGGLPRRIVLSILASMFLLTHDDGTRPAASPHPAE